VPFDPLFAFHRHGECAAVSTSRRREVRSDVRRTGFLHVSRRQRNSVLRYLQWSAEAAGRLLRRRSIEPAV